MRGLYESACIRTHPEIFGFRKVAIRKQFYIYGGKDQKFTRKPRKLNQNIPLLMDSSGFKVHNSASLHCNSFYILIQHFLFLLIHLFYVKTYHRFPSVYRN